jgi:tRNA synthetases class II (D, K and N)
VHSLGNQGADSPTSAVNGCAASRSGATRCPTCTRRPWRRPFRWAPPALVRQHRGAAGLVEYGMPPSGGMGMGMDRLLMARTGSGIRETIGVSAGPTTMS